MKSAVRVAITGAAGNIGYAVAFRIAAGNMLGADQPVVLKLIEIPPVLPALRGVEMELRDCAFPLLEGIVVTDDISEGFKDVEYALLIGSKPRTEGMERSDLLKDNGKIFGPQGRAINDHAARNVRVLVVGNPANTNCLIAARNAPDLEAKQFSSMTRLDHNRAISLLAEKTGAPVTAIQKMTIWGNHSLTQFPDIYRCQVNDQPAAQQVDPGWYKDEFIPRVQKRGGEIIKARGASSAASAASAAIDHMRDWVIGSAAGDWVSMGIMSVGDYGIADGVMYSYPVTCRHGEYSVVQDLELNQHAREMMKRSEQELLEEREAVAELIPA